MVYFSNSNFKVFCTQENRIINKIVFIFIYFLIPKAKCEGTRALRGTSCPYMDELTTLLEVVNPLISSIRLYHLSLCIY